MGARPPAAGNAPEPVGETGSSVSLEALKLRVACGLAANALPPKPSAEAVEEGGGKPEPEEVRVGTGGSAGRSGGAAGGAGRAPQRWWGEPPSLLLRKGCWRREVDTGGASAQGGLLGDRGVVGWEAGLAEAGRAKGIGARGSCSGGGRWRLREACLKGVLSLGCLTWPRLQRMLRIQHILQKSCIAAHWKKP